METLAGEGHTGHKAVVSLQSLESVVVFKSYDKSSGVSLRSSKVCTVCQNL